MIVLTTWYRRSFVYWHIVGRDNVDVRWRGKRGTARAAILRMASLLLPCMLIECACLFVNHGYCRVDQRMAEKVEGDLGIAAHAIIS